MAVLISSWRVQRKNIQGSARQVAKCVERIFQLKFRGNIDIEKKKERKENKF